MRISAIFMPFFAVVAGATGFYLRLLELWDVFDELTGLPRRGAGITLALFIVSAVFLVVVIVFAIRAAVKHASPQGFEKAFGTDPLAYPLIFTLLGIAWLGATVKHFLDIYATGVLQATELAFLILSALSAISVAFFAVEMYQDPRRKARYALSVIPTLFSCFWLILVYRNNASNPVLLSYCYQCLAIITATLGFYFTSGFVYNKPAPGKAIFSYFAATYFCFITLADDHPISIKIIIAVLIAVNLAYASMLIRNLKWKGVESLK